MFLCVSVCTVDYLDEWLDERMTLTTNEALRKHDEDEIKSAVCICVGVGGWV